MCEPVCGVCQACIPQTGLLDPWELPGERGTKSPNTRHQRLARDGKGRANTGTEEWQAGAGAGQAELRSLNRVCGRVSTLLTPSSPRQPGPRWPNLKQEGLPRKGPPCSLESSYILFLVISRKQPL